MIKFYNCNFHIGFKLKAALNFVRWRHCSDMIAVLFLISLLKGRRRESWGWCKGKADSWQLWSQFQQSCCPIISQQQLPCHFSSNLTLMHRQRCQPPPTPPQPVHEEIPRAPPPWERWRAPAWLRNCLQGPSRGEECPLTLPEYLPASSTFQKISLKRLANSRFHAWREQVLWWQTVSATTTRHQTIMRPVARPKWDEQQPFF